jgi:uncharacterized Tic20 family protein
MYPGRWLFSDNYDLIVTIVKGGSTKEQQMNSNYSSDERLMAAIAHASVVTAGPGILVGVVIWLTQKEKSAYAAWQGLQAAVYQLLGMIAIVLLWVLWGIFHGFTYIPMFLINPQQPPAWAIALFVIGIAAMVIPFLFMVVWGLYGLFGAYQCWRGREFRYILIGNFIPNFNQVAGGQANKPD